MFRIPIGQFFESIIDFLQDNIAFVFDTIKNITGFVVELLTQILQLRPDLWYVTLTLSLFLGLLATVLAQRKTGSWRNSIILGLVCAAIIGGLDTWRNSQMTRQTNVDQLDKMSEQTKELQSKLMAEAPQNWNETTKVLKKLEKNYYPMAMGKDWSKVQEGLKEMEASFKVAGSPDNAKTFEDELEKTRQAFKDLPKKSYSEAEDALDDLDDAKSDNLVRIEKEVYNAFTTLKKACKDADTFASKLEDAIEHFEHADRDDFEDSAEEIMDLLKDAQPDKYNIFIPEAIATKLNKLGQLYKGFTLVEQLEDLSEKFADEAEDLAEAKQEFAEIKNTYEAKKEALADASTDRIDYDAALTRLQKQLQDAREDLIYYEIDIINARTHEKILDNIQTLHSCEGVKLAQITPITTELRKVLKQFDPNRLRWYRWAILILALSALALTVHGSNLLIFTVLGFLLTVSMSVWDATMETLALILCATLFALIIGIPIGIWAAWNDKLDKSIRPILDLMQTMPPFVYLIPAVVLFGLGTVPGVIATLIFATPPAIRLTSLGIRQVPEDVVEAARAFGSSPMQLLFKVQLPISIPTILAGVNQTIMLSLSMVVIAGLIGGGGLGEIVVQAIQQLNIARGFEGGFAIVILAIYLDRVMQSVGGSSSSGK